MTASKEKFKMIDLFAGIGGFRLGCDQTGMFKTVYSCEISEASCQTYQANFHDNPKGDVTQLDPVALPDFDLLCAGFPCQPFSHAGKRNGFNDPRGTLFFDVARIIKGKKPKAVLLENVKGLVGHDKGKTFSTIINTLNELSYKTHWKVLNAHDFGVPQKRNRVYIVCLRSDLSSCDTFQFPVCNSKVKNPCSTIAPILERNVDERYFLSQQRWNSLVAHKARHPSGNGFSYVIVEPTAAASTICSQGARSKNLVIDMTTPTPSTSRHESVKNSLHIRIMTPRECARLQGFPESFKLAQKPSLAFAQLGNSVAVPVIQAIAERIGETLSLENKSFIEKPIYDI